MSAPFKGVADVARNACGPSPFSGRSRNLDLGVECAGTLHVQNSPAMEISICVSGLSGASGVVRGCPGRVGLGRLDKLETKDLTPIGVKIGPRPGMRARLIARLVGCGNWRQLSPDSLLIPGFLRRVWRLPKNEENSRCKSLRPRWFYVEPFRQFFPKCQSVSRVSPVSPEPFARWVWSSFSLIF